MDGILQGISFAFICSDDILVASRDAEEHLQYLRELFTLLFAHRIAINRKKCVLGKSEVKYLGHLVGEQGISPLLSRVSDLGDFLAPEKKVGQQRYLGMVNYYRRFVRKMANLLAPLHGAVVVAGKEKALTLSPARLQALLASKAVLASST